MRKSASVKNFVLLIRVILWERVRSRYGMSVLSGRYGCRTWLELVWLIAVYKRIEQYMNVPRYLERPTPTVIEICGISLLKSY